MTERMQNYRDRMSEKGLVQVRVWVEKQDVDFGVVCEKLPRGTK